MACDLTHISSTARYKYCTREKTMVPGGQWNYLDFQLMGSKSFCDKEIQCLFLNIFEEKWGPLKLKYSTLKVILGS